MKIHNVFHPNFLGKASIDLCTGYVNKPTLAVIVNNKEKWKVEEIFNARSFSEKIQYCVK